MHHGLFPFQPNLIASRVLRFTENGNAVMLQLMENYRNNETNAKVDFLSMHSAHKRHSCTIGIDWRKRKRGATVAAAVIL